MTTGMCDDHEEGMDSVVDVELELGVDKWNLGPKRDSEYLVEFSRYQNRYNMSVCVRVFVCVREGISRFRNFEIFKLITATVLPKVYVRKYFTGVSYNDENGNWWSF